MLLTFFLDARTLLCTRDRACETDERVPADLIPIATDADGNNICVGWKGKRAGKIHFWDHEDELDENGDFVQEEVQERIHSMTNGATFAHLNLKDIRNFPFPSLPSLPIQRRIAAILSGYDDLIENNTKRIKVLEEMARSLYREWFVQFRYPGHEKVKLVDSALGKVPEGWKVIELEAIASYINRGITPKYNEDADEIVINQKCIRDQRLSFDQARRHATKVPIEKYIVKDDVLINSTGVGTLGRVAQVLESVERCTVDTHVTIVRPSPRVDPHYFGLTLRGKEEYFESQGAGATNQTELARACVGATPIVNVPVALQREFGRLVAPMRLAGLALSKKNTNLRRTRDMLLPKLISGEMDVTNASGAG